MLYYGGEYSFGRVAYSKKSARKIAHDYVFDYAKHIIKTDKRFSNYAIKDRTNFSEKE